MRRRRWTVPAGFASALWLWAGYGVLHLMGLRDWVSVLSGTPVDGVPLELAAFGGALYVLAWFGAVLLAPVLTIASALRMLTALCPGASRGTMGQLRR